MQYFLFTLLGFVLGSTLFAYWIPKLLKNIDICTLPDDHNPGVSNAFMYGGFLCGILSLICELAKGFIPVYLGQKCLDINSLLFVPVLVAPVFGHAFPFLQKQKGGKAITASLRSPFGPVSGIASGCLSSIFLYILFSCSNNKSTFAQIYSDIWFFCIQCPFDYKNSLNPDWLLHNSRDCDIQTPDKAQ